MAGITDLPVEILDQIIGEISAEKQETLASLSLTCRSIYLQVLPTLYRTFRLRFYGRPSWPKRTETLRRLAPVGSYKIPSYTDETKNLVEATDRKGKGVAGRPAYSHGSSSPGNERKETKELLPRMLPLMYIREVVICGYWNTPQEEQSGEYFMPGDGSIREHTPFIEALEGLLYSIDRLAGFTWQVIRPLPPKISAAVARSDYLNSITIFGDTHAYSGENPFRYHQHTPAPITNSPLPFSFNNLVTLNALQTGDYQQVIEYGDVMRNGTNWETLRYFDFDVSPGFIGLLVEMEPMEPDILAALFRPPPPPRGRLTTPKMKLHRLKLRDVAFQHKGIAALTKSIDTNELREIDFYYCQQGSDLLRCWENNKLRNLERVHIKEELALPYLCRFLKQFGPEGNCKKLKILELCCWHVDRWNMYDQLQNSSMSMFAGYDSESELGFEDENEEFSDTLSDDTQSDYPAHPFADPMPHWVSRHRCSLPQPFRSIRDLRGNKEEGWGLERLVMDMRSGITSVASRQLPQQETFFEGFWRLRELAIPVSYETPESWNKFVETIARLPNLEYLFLLNDKRAEARSGSNYVTFSIYQLPFPPQAPSVQNSRMNKRKAKQREQEPDKLYVDALSIAAKNRLRVHGNGMQALNEASTSISAGDQSVWRGKLKYIGIRATDPTHMRQPVRVWKILVDDVPPKKAVPEGSAERRRTLRSNKRKKAENGDWRVVEEDVLKCRLEEVEDEAIKKKLGGGIFNGMSRSAENE